MDLPIDQLLPLGLGGVLAIIVLRLYASAMERHERELKQLLNATLEALNANTEALNGIRTTFDMASRLEKVVISMEGRLYEMEQRLIEVLHDYRPSTGGKDEGKI